MALPDWCSFTCLSALSLRLPQSFTALKHTQIVSMSAAGGPPNNQQFTQPPRALRVVGAVAVAVATLDSPVARPTRSNRWR